ncbi:MAG TPA: SpoIID/LytB domain-containing protein [Nitrospiraceae bacterium]|nr:SpoIID/LytB domain-containing protein [Nitrospiraceae bacterium]
MALSPLTRRIAASFVGLVLSLPIGLVPSDPALAESVRVLLAQDISQLEVRSDGDMVVGSQLGEARAAHFPLHVQLRADGIHVNGRRVSATALTIRPVRGGLYVMMGKNSAAADKNTAVGGTPSPPAGLPVSGALKVFRKGKSLSIVNQVDLEEYVKGVVPSEVSSSWHPEMLKVQAIAARTYALYNKMLSATREYDVVATIQDQVYRGRFGVDSRVEEAVERTRGIVVTHQHSPIYAAFSSTAAGPTEDAVNVWANKDLPYLKGVECPFDLDSPYYQWKASVKIDQLERNLRQQGFAVGTIATITPIAYSRAGRVARLRILHSDGEVILRGEDLRKAVGYTIIPSTQFEVESVGAEVTFAGYGAGHAVGLCQWGAKELAELGYSYASILAYYYPGTELQNAAVVQLASPSVPLPHVP